VWDVKGFDIAAMFPSIYRKWTADGPVDSDKGRKVSGVESLFVEIRYLDI